MTWATEHMGRDELITLGLTLAIRFAVSDLELNALRTKTDEPGWWYDTRPMLDPREHCGQAVDMAVETLRFGEAAGAFLRHPTQRHLVRILVSNQATANQAATG